MFGQEKDFFYIFSTAQNSRPVSPLLYRDANVADVTPCFSEL